MSYRETIINFIAGFDWHHAVPFFTIQMERRGVKLDINDLAKTAIMALVSIGFSMYVAQQLMANELHHLSEGVSRNTTMIEKVDNKIDRHVEWEVKQRLEK